MRHTPRFPLLYSVNSDTPTEPGSQAVGSLGSTTVPVGIAYPTPASREALGVSNLNVLPAMAPTVSFHEQTWRNAQFARGRPGASLRLSARRIIHGGRARNPSGASLALKCILVRASASVYRCLGGTRETPSCQVQELWPSRMPC